MVKVYSDTFEWRFARPPEKIWSALADTARWNEAAGLPKHAIEEVLQPDGSVRFFGRARKGVFALEWEEIPVEWVDRQWFRHLRVFSRGPIRTLCATLRIGDDGTGGTLARYTAEATAANLIGTLILETVFLKASRRIFTELADSTRDWSEGRRERPFEAKRKTLSPPERARLDAMVARVEESANVHQLVRRLLDWMLAAQEIDLMIIRPLELAHRWGTSGRTVVELCLQSVKDGLLELRWDLLCPRCRGAKLAVTSLDQLPRGAHCNSCNIDYDRDFSRNVELTFHPAPAVRDVVAGEFCLFGPMTTPHVKVQVTLDPGETRDLEGQIAAGDYRLRTREIGGEHDLTYESGAFPSAFAEAGGVTIGVPLREGMIRLTNNEDRRRTLIIESRDWVRDALTAHQATTLQVFRDLFADAVLRPGDEVGISQITMLFTDLKGSTALYERIGDAAAYQLVHEHFAYLSRAVRERGGTIVKTMGDAVMAVFADPVDAVHAALAVQSGVQEFNRASASEDIVIKVGLHGGPCIAVNLNEKLDYFGTTINMAARLQALSQGGDIVFSTWMVADPAVREILGAFQLAKESQMIPGFGEPVTVHRLTTEALASGEVATQ